MNLIIEQLGERAKFILCIIAGILFVVFVLDPIVKQIGKLRQKKRIMTLAREMRKWSVYELKGEEKRLNDKIIEDNRRLSLAQFLTTTNEKDDIEINGLEYREPFPYQYPWEDVAESLIKLPDRISFNHSICPDCKRQRIRLFFTSPEITWNHLCGVAGYMIICPHCKKQVSFNETMRN